MSKTTRTAQTATVIRTIDIPAAVWLARHTRPERLVRLIARALYLEDTRAGGPRPAVVAAWRRERERYLSV